jgi:hypothetical protein
MLNPRQKEALARRIAQEPGKALDQILSSLNAGQLNALANTMKFDGAEEKARIRRAIEILEGSMNATRYAEVIAALQGIHDRIQE